VIISGLGTRFLIDTGATVTILSSDVYAKIPSSSRPILEQPSENFKVEIADSTLVDVTGIVKLSFKAGNTEFLWPVYIAPISDTGLLGMDFLYAHDYNIGVEGLLQLNGTAFILDIEGISPNLHKVTLVSDVVLPAGAEYVAMGAMSTKDKIFSGNCVVESIPWTPINSDIIVGNTLVDIDRTDKGIPVRLMNTGSENIKLYSGITLGQVQPVELVAVLAEQENDTSQVTGQARSACNINSAKTSSNDDDFVDPVVLLQAWPEPVQRLYKDSAPSLNQEQSVKFATLLNRSVDLFAKSSTDLGQTTLACHTIDTGDAKPIKQRPRRPPLAFAHEEDKIIQEQLEAGIIRESTSPWSSPLVYVKKRDGSTRPCVDYRRLNEVTTKDAYPLPRIDHCLDCLSGAELFSTLDLQSGYWQLPVKEEDKPKTAFITRSGLWEYNCLPFGLSGAPATFERCMELVLKGLQWKSLLVYLDDIILFGSTVEEHLDRLDEVFQRLMKAGLKLKPGKCELLKKEVAFLGHVVNGEGVKPDPSKVSVVKNWPVPKVLRDVRSYLGLCSYYRRFIEGFSTLARPLHRLTEAGVIFEWSIECQKSFDALKNALSSDNVMAYPRHHGLFILDTDASDFGIGGVLSQMQWCEKTQAEVERPIAFASKSMTRTQRRYCVTRRELLAIVYYTQYFKHYLLGRTFVVRTDHCALRWLMSFREPENQMARWLELLSQFDFKVIHRPGAKHTNADALSRMPYDQDECQCYDGHTILGNLPCGGCDKCLKKHREWSAFFELDDTVPLAAKVREIKVTMRNEARIMQCTKSSEDGGSIPDKGEDVKSAWDTGRQLLSGNCAWQARAIAGMLVVLLGIMMLCVRKVCDVARGKVLDGLIWTRSQGGRLLSRRHTILNQGLHNVNRVNVTQGAMQCRGTLLHNRHHIGTASGTSSGRQFPIEPGGSHDQSGDVDTRQWFQGYSSHDISELQMKDPDLGKIIQWLKSTKRPDRDIVAAESHALRQLWLNWDQLLLDKNVLHRKCVTKDRNLNSESKQTVLPACLHAVVLSAMHDSVTAGHMGVKKTYGKLKKCFYWPGMKSAVRDWIRTCPKCGARKRPQKTSRAPLNTYRVGAPMDRLSSDILGPFPVSERSNRYILVVMDNFSKWVEAYPIPDFTAETVARTIVYEFISRFGNPLEIHTDQGRNYESGLFQEMCKMLDIHKTRTTPYHPSSNGAVERFNQTLVHMISAYVDKVQSNWDENLPLLTAAYRSTVHESTNFTPNMLMLGREVHLPIELLVSGLPNDVSDAPAGTSQYVMDLKKRMTDVFHHAREHLGKTAEGQKKRYDTRIAKNNYQAGNMVYALDTTKKVGLSPKLKTDVWKGPLVVSRKISDLLFEVKGAPQTRTKILHHDRLKPYVSRDVPEWARKLSEKYRKTLNPKPTLGTTNTATQCSLLAGDTPSTSAADDHLVGVGGHTNSSTKTVPDSTSSSAQSNNTPRRSHRPRRAPVRLGVD
jgi:transposase InsO family protein